MPKELFEAIMKEIKVQAVDADYPVAQAAGDFVGTLLCTFENEFFDDKKILADYYKRALEQMYQFQRNA